MDKRTTVGIDLAKDVFAVCVLDAHGGVVERKVLRRAAFERWAESLAVGALRRGDGSLRLGAALGLPVRRPRPHGAPDGLGVTLRATTTCPGG